MKSINWKVRIKNKLFWLGVIPLMLLLAQQVCALFGFTIEIEWLSDQLKALIETVFGILAIVGVVADPTTAGIKDSEQALTYTEPKKENAGD